MVTFQRMLKVPVSTNPWMSHLLMKQMTLMTEVRTKMIVAQAIVTVTVKVVIQILQIQSSSGSSEYESGSENKSSGESSKSSKLGSEKINVHDNETDDCDITSEKKESAEVPVEEKDDKSVPQHGDEGVPDTGDGGVPDTGDRDVSDPGDDLLLEKLMRETDQLEEQSPIPGAKVDRRSKHRHLVTASKI